MVALFQFLAFAGSIGLVASAAVTTTTATTHCTTVTRTASYDDLPTGTMNPKVPYKGLLYDGWEVVNTYSTPFQANTGDQIIRLVGQSGTIKTANSSIYYNDLGGYVHPSYYIGCENTTIGAAYNCEFNKQYATSGNPVYSGFYNSTAYPHDLEEAGALNYPSTQSIIWSSYTGIGSNAPPQLVFFMDTYRYTLSNCQQ